MATTLGAIKNVSDFLDVIRKSDLSKKKNHPHLRRWFRGQSEAGWDLRPGVYRQPWWSSLRDENSFKPENEKFRLRAERHMTQDFRAYSASLRKGGETDEEIYFLQQHYRMPTRLLDWTGNPLAALYFTVRDQKDKDGEVFFMDVFQLAHTQGVRKRFEGVGTSRNRIFKDAIAIISNWQGSHDNFPDFVIPIRPDHFDPRVTRQQSYFTFHVPSRPTLTANENDTLAKVIVPSDVKGGIETELSLLGMNAFAAFGSLESLSDWLKNTQPHLAETKWWES